MEFMREIMAKVMELPEAKELLLKIERGEVKPEEGIIRLQEILEGTTQSKEIMTTFDSLKSMGFDVDRMTYQHPNGEKHLNPLFEAKIVERLSQDGDIPELRVGPLPKGCKPAVPVLTYATDPVVIGLQLERASDQVLGMLEAQTQKYIKNCEENNYLVRPSPPIDLEGLYETGKTPLLLSADPVLPSETSKLTPEKKRELAHKCIGTTQGRRSCVPPIEALIRKKFSDNNIKLVVGNYTKTFTCRWQIETWGAEDLSENFSPIMQAAESFFNAFKQNVDAESTYMYIKPINGYSDRIYGWVCKFDY